MRYIKICGITEEKEAEYLNEAGVDFAGFIQFVPKSRRNISVQRAVSIMKDLSPEIRPVAVTISPGAEALRAIEAAGFFAVQIHGSISDTLLKSISIPVIKAFNVNDLSEYERFHRNRQVAGYIFDAQVPGSGKSFDWSLLQGIPRDEKLAFLAGGICPENVVQALLTTGIPGVDVSSGVENEDGRGKNRDKILKLVELVRGMPDTTVL